MASSPRRRRRCSFCKELFLPDPRLKSRQVACSKAACQKARKRANQEDWLRRHPGYFKGRYPNTKTWLQERPGYQRDYRRRRPERARQDNLLRRKRREIAREVRAAMQDSISLQEAVLEQLTPDLFSSTPAALQDSMVPTRRRKYPLSPEAPGASLWRDLLAEQLHVLENKTVKGKPPKIQKEPLEPQRVRRIPAEGFSWIDRRFVREGFIERLPPEAILLYLFLVAVSDARGLSFYAEGTISRILQLDHEEITQARARLITADLILYRYPLYQVLALPEKKRTAPGVVTPLRRAHPCRPFLERAKKAVTEHRPPRVRQVMHNALCPHRRDGLRAVLLSEEKRR